MIESPVRRQVVVIGRQMSAAFGERDGQMAGRICLSEQNIGDGAAFLLSCIPLYKDGGYMLLFPCDGERLSVTKTSTTGFPVAWTACINFPWAPVRERSVRSKPSPQLVSW